PIACNRPTPANGRRTRTSKSLASLGVTRARYRDAGRDMSRATSVHARAEDAVAGVAEARKDVALLVEALIDRGGIDRDVRMRGLERAQAFRSSDQEDAADPAGACALEHVDGGDQGAAGGQHRVEDQRVALIQAAGQPFEIGRRLQRLLVALQA